MKILNLLLFPIIISYVLTQTSITISAQNFDVGFGLIGYCNQKRKEKGWYDGHDTNVVHGGSRCTVMCIRKSMSLLLGREVEDFQGIFDLPIGTPCKGWEFEGICKQRPYWPYGVMCDKITQSTQLTTKKISKNGAICIAKREVFCPNCYLDRACKWTIGIGFLVGNDTSAEERCRKMEPMNFDSCWKEFQKKLVEYEGYVNKYVKKPLNDDQFDALVSFAYNTGPRGIKSLAETINTADFSKVRAKMAEYNKITNSEGEKVVDKGLVNRRKFEADMFDSKTKPCLEAEIPKPEKCKNTCKKKQK